MPSIPRSEPRAAPSLELVAFERYLLADDCERYPMQFHCRLHFTGRLQRNALEAAHSEALARHPLLTSIVRGTAFQPCEEAPPLDWFECEPRSSMPPFAYWDIRQAPPIRVTVVQGSRSCELVARIHHVAIDGTGAQDFLGDLLTIYADRLTGTRTDRLKPLDPRRLRRRGELGLTFAKRLRRLPSDLASLFRARGFYKRRPLALSDRPRDSSLPMTEECSLRHCFGKEETAAIHRQAAENKASVNSLLLSRLFSAIDEFRPGSSDWLRIAVPINMRQVGDRRMPAANLVSMVFLDRPQSALENPARLLEDISNEMEAVKRDELGLRLTRALEWEKWLPGKWFRKVVRRNRAWATTMLTNIGPALPGCRLPRREGRFVVGDAILEEFDLIPIVRPFQPVNFAVATYAGRLSLTARVDTRAIALQDAKRLFDGYVRQFNPR